MLVVHPGVAAIDCEDCQKRLYDLETGKPATYRAGRNKETRYYDGPDHKPQCRQSIGCPKGSPETAKDTELSPANWAAVDLYRAVRATSGAILVGQMVDRLMAQNLAIVDEIFRDGETQATARRNAVEMSKLRR